MSTLSFYLSSRGKLVILLGKLNFKFWWVIDSHGLTRKVCNTKQDTWIDKLRYWLDMRFLLIVILRAKPWQWM